MPEQLAREEHLKDGIHKATVTDVSYSNICYSPGYYFRLSVIIIQLNLCFLLNNLVDACWLLCFIRLLLVGDASFQYNLNDFILELFM